MICLAKKTDLIHRGMKKGCALLAKALSCPYDAVIIKYEEGKEQAITISYPALPVKPPGNGHPLVLVVAKGFGKEPMMLVTSCTVNTTVKEHIWRIVKIYLIRWKR